jgi:hypothetical protein
VAQFVAKLASKTVSELGKQVKTFDATKDEEILRIVHYGPGGVGRYEPDFVVETEDAIYMVETKAAGEINSDAVKEKAVAAMEYCRAVTEWNAENGGKPWQDTLLSHDEVHL